MVHEQSASQLMEQILAARNSCLTEQPLLCKKLLALSEQKGDTYGIAFACVYLTDSFLALGNYSDCQFYLMRAQSLCEENGFGNLLLPFYNIAGLYHKDMNDEQSAVLFYLKGLGLARQYNDKIVEGKLLNNIGVCFYAREDYTLAQQYFWDAYQIVAPFVGQESGNVAFRFLSNVAEVSQAIGDKESSSKALQLCERHRPSTQNWAYQGRAAWCGHWALCGEREKSIALAEQLLADKLNQHEDKHFARGLLIQLCNAMLEIDSQRHAHKLLMTLEPLCAHDSTNGQATFLQLHIRYSEKYGTPAECSAVYRRHYRLSKEIARSDNVQHVKSLVSIIELTQALLDRQSILQENKTLEKASHLDELTQLYNRRYLFKLVSKILFVEKAKRIGFIMLDIDYFKQYNDLYGHFKGDDILKAVAALLNKCEEPGIYPSRYGGDEFLCLCINCTDSVLSAYVQNLRKSLKQQAIPHETSLCSPYVTLSIGWCNEPFSPGHAPQEQIMLADQALYRVKSSGRNGHSRMHASGQCDPVQKSENF